MILKIMHLRNASSFIHIIVNINDITLLHADKDIMWFLNLIGEEQGKKQREEARKNGGENQRIDTKYEHN